MSFRTLVFAIAITTGLPIVASADTQTEVQGHLAKAAAAYKDKRWQEVLDELDKAYALDPRPELRYSIGQVYVKMDRCPDAIIAYEKYLATNPPTENAGVAREAIEVCKKQIAAQPTLEPPPPTPPTPQPVAPMPPPIDHPRGERWYQDKLGVGLIGGGAALVIASVVVYSLARSAASDAETAPTYGEQVDQYDSARSKRVISVVLGVGGAAVLGVGIYHYMTKKPRTEHGVGLIPTRDGGFVTWTSGF